MMAIKIKMIAAGIALSVVLSGCAAHSSTYQANANDFWGAGNFDVPPEFRDGSAQLADVKAWSESLLGAEQSRFLPVIIETNRPPWLFVCRPDYGGTGGNKYIIFRQEGEHFRYLGVVGFSTIVPITPADGKARFLTSSASGSGEALAAVWILKSNRIEELAHAVLPAGDSASDGQGGLLYRRLFESQSVTDETLREAFGNRL